MEAIQYEPSEPLEDFQKRILEADTKRGLKHGYSIVDVIGLAGGNLMRSYMLPLIIYSILVGILLARSITEISG